MVKQKGEHMMEFFLGLSVGFIAGATSIIGLAIAVNNDREYLDRMPSDEEGE